MFPSCVAYARRLLEERPFLAPFYIADRFFFREWGTLSRRYHRAPGNLSCDLRYWDPVEELRRDFRPSFLKEDFQAQRDCHRDIRQ